MPATLSHETRDLLFPPRPSAPRLEQRARAMGAAFLDLIAPPHCASCQAPLPPLTNVALCRLCAEKVRWIGADRCKRCGDATGEGSGIRGECPSCRTHPPAYVSAACSVARYLEGPIRDVVLGLKFGGQVHLAKTVGRLMAQRLSATGLAAAGILVIAVPPARKTWVSRSLNHTTEIAGIIARELNLTVAKNILRKIRSTLPQATLNDEQRRTNLKDAFACAPAAAKKLAGRTVLLVDDVITTGSTISECARTLHAAGAADIRAVSLARG